MVYESTENRVQADMGRLELAGSTDRKDQEIESRKEAFRQEETSDKRGAAA